jgi:hypothetical protein
MTILFATTHRATIHQLEWRLRTTKHGFQPVKMFALPTYEYRKFYLWYLVTALVGKSNDRY